MSKYDIYNKMFNYCDIIAEGIKESLLNNNARVYTCDVYVGKEEELLYEIYVEFAHDNTGYQFIRGLYPIETINKKFRTNLHGIN